MSIETSYTEARANLAKLCDRVVDDRETAHLLRSPNNATRLLAALNRARSGQGTATTMDDLRWDVGLAEEG